MSASCRQGGGSLATGAAGQAGFQARGTALRYAAQAALQGGVGTPPEIVHRLAAQARGLGFGQVVDLGLQTGIRREVEHGELRWVNRSNCAEVNFIDNSNHRK
jgi:hypothetical protein